MSKLPPVKELKKEDFSDVEWIDKLLWPINRFMSSVYRALNQGLTFTDNFRAQIKEFEFTQAANTYPLKFAWDIRGASPTDLWVTRVVTLKGAAPNYCFPIWEYDGSSVSITFNGLTDTNKYKIRITAIAG